MKLPFLLTFLAAGLAFTTLASADTTIAYPNADDPDFTVTAPDDWHFVAGSKDNPYCTLSKSDTILYFKTVEGTGKKLDEAIDQTYDYVQETYPKAELPEVKETEIDGKHAVAAAGSGKNKEGVQTQFGFAWVFFGEDKIAELWFESAESDKGVAAEASAILESFKAKK